VEYCQQKEEKEQQHPKHLTNKHCFKNKSFKDLNPMKGKAKSVWINTTIAKKE